MDLQLLEHRVRVTSIDKSGLWFYTHPIVKLLFLRHRTRCKFFSLTETPEDYTLMLDEEGFADLYLAELPQSDFLHVAENTWRVLNVLSNGIQTGGVTKIAKSVIAPLAEHNVSVLMLSTYQTDYILVREDDLPIVFQTLVGELTIYKEENGELVRLSLGEATNGLKTRSLFHLTLHPVQSPANRFCILTLDRDNLQSISTILLDVLFYSQTSHEDSASQSCESFRFFAFSLIDGYISIVMDTETQKKFPTDLLLTSSSRELWCMVRIGGQPLGFDECGIVAQIAGPLATADISAYYVSTFNFDHALVPEEDIDSVIKLLHEREENKS
ncbi:cytosolic arginine sensor for mTORC1 subunit 1 isoform X1 [Hyla sarda]|uniref:cytosolic arginine sensor for mTORC1 subunit 1 isoform X1 n=1 Tax=Hyla sarda TaxID=327740 RepID=UPI0024C3D185|nr:cytosolic arginine sensor for mTORC1 subunit 1 isoform X1 [Hyla sarda]XP_056384652.1 cytosolic arginine sensor for mTORC1 subunit 1 isoform X1 [Hyla sarda]